MVHAAQSSVPGCCMSHKQVAKGIRLQHQPASRVGVAACRWRAAHVPLALQPAQRKVQARSGAPSARYQLPTSPPALSQACSTSTRLGSRRASPSLTQHHIQLAIQRAHHSKQRASLILCRQQRQQQRKPQLAASALCIGLSSSHAHNAAPRAADDGPLATRAAPPALHIPGAPARHGGFFHWHATGMQLATVRHCDAYYNQGLTMRGVVLACAGGDGAQRHLHSVPGLLGGHRPARHTPQGAHLRCMRRAESNAYTT